MSKTYQPKKKKRAGTHGFLRRQKSKTGRQVMQKRRQKGRKRIAL
jgi:large subunit ribosomal protein L34